MLRTHSFLLFSLSIGSAFLLKVAHLPDQLIWLATASLITGAVFANLMPIRTSGMAIGVAGLVLVYHNAPDPSVSLAALLAFLAILVITATALLIAADLSTAMEKNLREP